MPCLNKKHKVKKNGKKIEDLKVPGENELSLTMKTEWIIGTFFHEP